jgi:hypothetical protein
MKKIVFLFVLALSGFQIYAQEFSASYNGVQDIKLTTGSGNVELIKGSASAVEVRLVHEMGPDYSPDIRQQGNNLIIADGNKRIQGRIEWYITMPDNMDVNLTTGSGNVNVSGLTIDLKSINGSGNFDISNVKGLVRTNTGSGNIDIENFEGEFKGNTGSGNADIRDFTGEIVVNCGSGNIDIKNANAEVNANVGSGSIDVDDFILAGESGFNSGSGNVTVGLGATPVHDLSINSGSGSATLDRNNHDLNADIIMTASKKSGKIQAPYTFDSEDEIDEGDYIKIRKTVSVGSGNKVKISIGTGSGTARIK